MSRGHGKAGPKRHVVEILSGWACNGGVYSRKVKLECGHVVAQAGRRAGMVNGDYVSDDIRNLKWHKSAWCHICKIKGKR